MQITENKKAELVVKTNRNSVSFGDFKKSLGSMVNNYSDEEIKHIYELTERLAKTLFDGWVKNLQNSKK